MRISHSRTADMFRGYTSSCINLLDDISNFNFSGIWDSIESYDNDVARLAIQFR